MKIETRRCKGFSLIELMTVISIIAFLIAMAAPTVLTMRSTSLSAGGRHLQQFFVLARSEAIAQNTVIRVGIVREWPGDPDAAHRKLGIWKWSDEREEFVQSGPWKTLQEGLVIEPSFPSWVHTAEYAKDDPVNVHAFTPRETRQLPVDGKNVRVTLLDFMPNGRVRAPDGGLERKLALVLVSGHTEGTRIVRTGPKTAFGEPSNWAQVNLDTLTGRIEILRP